MNTIFIIKVKILMLIKWSYRSPNHVDFKFYNGLYISSMYLYLFQTYVLLVLVLTCTPNHMPLKYMCPSFFWYSI